LAAILIVDDGPMNRQFLGKRKGVD